MEKLHGLEGVSERGSRCANSKPSDYRRKLHPSLDDAERSLREQAAPRAHLFVTIHGSSAPKESATDLRKLYHSVRSIVGALESIGRPITRGEDLFVHLTVELLDSRSRRDWEHSVSPSTEPPTYTELLEFLERRMHILESLQPVKAETSSATLGSSSSKQTRALHARKQDSRRGRCSLCHQDHYILLCDAYQTKTAEERKRHVKAADLCLNCLGRHQVDECSSTKRCTTCRAPHHTTLHDAFWPSEVVTSHTMQKPPEAPLAVLLAIARVRVADRFGKFHAIQALIDPGSESSLIAESLSAYDCLGVRRRSLSSASAAFRWGARVASFQ